MESEQREGALAAGVYVQGAELATDGGEAAFGLPPRVVAPSGWLRVDERFRLATREAVAAAGKSAEAEKAAARLVGGCLRRMARLPGGLEALAQVVGDQRAEGRVLGDEVAALAQLGHLRPAGVGRSDGEGGRSQGRKAGANKTGSAGV